MAPLVIAWDPNVDEFSVGDPTHKCPLTKPHRKQVSLDRRWNCRKLVEHRAPKQINARVNVTAATFRPFLNERRDSPPSINLDGTVSRRIIHFCEHQRNIVSPADMPVDVR